MQWSDRLTPAQRVALWGILCALAVVIGFFEHLLPLPIPIPVVKLGWANLVVVIMLYVGGPRDAVVIALLRVLLSALAYQGPSGLLFSLAGCSLSLAAMALTQRSGRFSVVGVSMAGGVAHNLGQLATAACIVQTQGLLWYLPILLLAGLVTGLLNGCMATWVLRRLSRISKVKV